MGKPILPGRTEVEQLHQIYKLCGSEVRRSTTAESGNNTSVPLARHAPQTAAAFAAGFLRMSHALRDVAARA